MAAKKNKAKKMSKNEGIGKRQRLGVPQEVNQLLQSYYRIRRKGNPLHCIGMSTIGTTKTWIPTPSRCHRNGEQRWPQLFRLDDLTYYEYFLDNCAFTNQKAAIVGRQILKSGFYQLESPKYECLVVDPFDAKKKYIEFTSVVGFEGKLYALSLQGALAVIEIIDSRRTITGISSYRAVPSVSSRFFKEYFVEVNGEIFVVFFIHEKSLEIVDQVEVFRLCFVKLKWVKVERLQGKTLFFDLQCIWVNSAEIGCRGDCVYFTQGSDNKWWIYDMESGCISPV